MIKPEGIWACTVLGGKAGIVDGKTLAGETLSDADAALREAMELDRG